MFPTESESSTASEFAVPQNSGALAVGGGSTCHGASATTIPSHTVPRGVQVESIHTYDLVTISIRWVWVYYTGINLTIFVVKLEG